VDNCDYLFCWQLGGLCEAKKNICTLCNIPFDSVSDVKQHVLKSFENKQQLSTFIWTKVGSPVWLFSEYIILSNLMLKWVCGQFKQKSDNLCFTWYYWLSYISISHFNMQQAQTYFFVFFIFSQSISQHFSNSTWYGCYCYVNYI